MNKAYIIMGLPKNDREEFLENFLKTNKGENCLVVSTRDILKGISEAKETNKNIVCFYNEYNIEKRVLKFKEIKALGYYLEVIYIPVVNKVKKTPISYNEGVDNLIIETTNKVLLDNILKDPYQGYAFYLRKGKEKIEEFSGFESFSSLVPIRRNSCFRLASVSKQFIAHGIKLLIDEGKLSLNTNLYCLFKDMPLYTKNITIANLLYHTSGIYDYEDMEHTDKQIDDYDVLDFVRETTTTYFEIGSQYRYSNTAYIVLGLIIERMTYLRVGLCLNEMIFKPLKMTSSMANYEGETNVPNRVYGTVKEEGKLIQKDQYWCSATIGDGGIYSCIEDLKKWVKFLSKTNYKELKESTFKPNILPNGTDSEYGYGIRIKNINGYEVIYHCGKTIGTNTIVGFVKELDMEFVLLTNFNDVDTSVFIENLKKVL